MKKFMVTIAVVALSATSVPAQLLAPVAGTPGTIPVATVGGVGTGVGVGVGVGVGTGIGGLGGGLFAGGLGIAGTIGIAAVGIAAAGAIANANGGDDQPTNGTN